MGVLLSYFTKKFIAPEGQIFTQHLMKDLMLAASLLRKKNKIKKNGYFI